MPMIHQNVDGTCDMTCEKCQARVRMTWDMWVGEEPFPPPHREWRVSLLHLFADGRPWLYGGSLKGILGRRLLLWANRLVLSAPCSAEASLVNFSAMDTFKTSGFARLGPIRPQGWTSKAHQGLAAAAWFALARRHQA